MKWILSAALCFAFLGGAKQPKEVTGETEIAYKGYTSEYIYKY